MAHLALTAIGRDRPGIVAAVSQVLADHGLNVEDSRMTILGGHFAMMLIVAAPPSGGLEALRGDLLRARDELGLEALALSEVAEVEGPARPPSHVLSVYGADHPGIVSAVSSALASHGANITDLETRLVGAGEGRPLYVMTMEVALPGELDPATLEEALGAVGREQGVDVAVRELEQDVL